MIFQALLIFILSSWINRSFARPDQSIDISYNTLIKKIHTREIGIYRSEYNPSKTAAIIFPELGPPVYINFKTKQTYRIVDEWPGIQAVGWLNDSTVHIVGSCGTGCGRSVIFIAPSTVVSCSTHEYRIEELNPHYPPDFRHNRPLLIDVKKGIYVCYDNVNNIQVFPLPKHPTIRPPKGYYSEKAEIKQGKLFVIYENGHGKIKRVSYGEI